MPPRKKTETEPKESKERTRVRLDADIEEYLKSQSERVLGKPTAGLDGTDLSVIANRILYEHRMAQLMVKQVPFAKLLNSLLNWVPGSSKVVALPGTSEVPALSASEAASDDFDFDADLGDLYEQDVA